MCTLSQKQQRYLSMNKQFLQEKEVESLIKAFPKQKGTIPDLKLFSKELTNISGR